MTNAGLVKHTSGKEVTRKQQQILVSLTTLKFKIYRKYRSDAS
jgi:hypothetical protein